MRIQSQPTGNGRAGSAPTVGSGYTMGGLHIHLVQAPGGNNAEVLNICGVRGPVVNPIKEPRLQLPRKTHIKSYPQFQELHVSLEALMSPRLGFPF